MILKEIDANHLEETGCTLEINTMEELIEYIKSIENVNPAFQKKSIVINEDGTYFDYTHWIE